MHMTIGLTLKEGQSEGFQKLGAKKNIWPSEEGSNRKLEKPA